MRLAHSRGIYVLADECYVYLNFTEAFFGGIAHRLQRAPGGLGSLSKTYAMTGWRMGFALSPAPITAAMNKLQSQSTSNPTSIVQKAAIAALNGPQECVHEMMTDYVKLREHLISGLRDIPGVTCAMPQGAFYAYPNVSKFFGKGGMNSAADVASNCCARLTWWWCRAKRSEPRNTFAYRTQPR